MKLDLLASVTVSLAVHAGAAVMVGGWLEKMPPGAPAASPGIEEVIIEFSGGDEVAAEDSSTMEIIIEPQVQDRPQVATAPQEKAVEAPPAPTVMEAPSTIGPAQEASTLNKVAEIAPTRDTPKIIAGNPALKTRGSAPRSTSGGGTTEAEYHARASLVYPMSALRDRAAGRVVLSVELNENGKAVSFSVKVSSGRSDLDDAAMACARRSTYKPYRVDGVAQSRRVDAPFEFKAPRQ